MSGIDWSPVTNLLVTCGHDRNAYVWRYDAATSTWKPTLVILRINRAATSVRWSPSGNKFAVSSGAKCVPVCHFEQQNDWWISRMIKKHKSTVLSLAWSPNGKFLVTGSADMKCRVFSAFMEGIDSTEDSEGYGALWKDQHEFGEALAEYEQGKAWVHSVAWAPSGKEIAFAAHSSILTFVSLFNSAQPSAGQQSVLCHDLPYLDIAYVNDSTLVAAGFDSNVDVYSNGGAAGWSLKDRLDKKSGAAAAAGKLGSVAAAAFGGAKKLFSEAADKGGSFGQGIGGTEMLTRHKNVIVNLCLLDGGKKISTAGLDGRIITWTL